MNSVSYLIITILLAFLWFPDSMQYPNRWQAKALSYEGIIICATVNIALSVIGVSRTYKTKLTFLLISKMAIFIDLAMVGINLFIIKYAIQATDEDAIPFNVV